MDQEYKFTANTYKKIMECPASMGPSSKNKARPFLDRWVSLNEVIGDWLYNDATSEEISIEKARKIYSDNSDSIQIGILDGLFKAFREIFPKTESLKMSRNYPPIPRSEIKDLDDGDRIILSSWVQYEVGYKDSERKETIKLRTANSDPLSQLDLAILSLQKDKEETYLEVNATKGTIDELPFLENASEVVEEAFLNIQEYLESDKKKTVPGTWCSRCDRSSLCGRYQEIDGKKINSKDRSFFVSKTDLLKLNTCSRQLAWKNLYGLPKQSDPDSEYSNYGDKFHTYAEKIINEFKEPMSEYGIEKFSQAISEEEEGIREKLLGAYSSLVEKMSSYENVELKQTEFALGFSLLIDNTSNDGSNSVFTYMGMADIVGRIGDNTPVVVELKTGKEREDHKYEAELYALGASIATKEEKVIVLHVYMQPESSKIVERVYGEKEISKAKEFFITKSIEISSWNPIQTLSPNYNVGSWCEYCSYETRCLENRN